MGVHVKIKMVVDRVVWLIRNSLLYVMFAHICMDLLGKSAQITIVNIFVFILGICYLYHVFFSPSVFSLGQNTACTRKCNPYIIKFKQVTEFFMIQLTMFYIHFRVK